MTAAGTIAEVVAASDIVMISLPSGKHVLELCEGTDGLLARMRHGPDVSRSRHQPGAAAPRMLAQRFAAKGIDYADAPVARTRKAAEDGTLSITVGGSAGIFARIEPLLRCFASDVTHCGDIGSGQAVKILNNMMIVCTIVALSEANATAKGGRCRYQAAVRGAIQGARRTALRCATMA